MIAKKNINYNLKRTNEKLTSRSGIVVFGEFLNEIGIYEMLNAFPKPLSGRGYTADTYMLPLMYMLYGGGSAITHIREIRNDTVLHDLLDLKTIPSDSAFGDWLVRLGESKGITAIEAINDKVNERIMQNSNLNELTLVIDPSIIETTKRDAHMTYLGSKGYRPALAFISELKIILDQEFRHGNDMGDKLKFLKKAFTKIPSNKRIGNVLLDAEFYTANIINYLGEQRCTWAISASKDVAVMQSIRAIPENDWQPLIDKHGFATDREIADTVHSMNGTKNAFRLVVIRWKDKEGKWCFHAVASNKEGSPTAVLHYYNQRADDENQIKECKGGFNLKRLPSGNFYANALYFAIGILTYNCFVAQKLLTMPKELHNKTIDSIRWMLIETPGKLIRHANKWWLKIYAGIQKFNIFTHMRERIRSMAIT